MTCLFVDGAALRVQVAKGPNSAGVVRTARELGGVSVRGNHEFEVRYVMRTMLISVLRVVLVVVGSSELYTLVWFLLMWDGFLRQTLIRCLLHVGRRDRSTSLLFHEASRHPARRIT